MKLVVIDGAAVTSMEEIHRLLARELEFPDWYGNNLDALHDCLTELSEETCIALLRQEELASALGSSYVRLCRVLANSAEENPWLTIQM